MHALVISNPGQENNRSRFEKVEGIGSEIQVDLINVSNHDPVRSS
jgi:hypothetical protein